MYSEALKLFNVEICKSGRGHIVVVTDYIENPIRLSNFKERPKFYKGLQAEKESQVNSQVLDKFHIAQWVRDLNRLANTARSSEQNEQMKLKMKKKGKQKRL